ncbi:BTAD domain-containing putative transcriptional regulator [Streptacidiphilus jiangxiensis]|uniref:Predicted ATPase n=1 Tax=Streptacidiphilus jiangxiensis TaxID=235985 RepID=A0A1H7V410_STRJI|nr:BTAD domain-containing putative transcriptional regulator [Streptacidiphilus jiangxiensis]SEM03648.1 Predicted ATPase [Streptacidiphilus jiangxiensis]
MQIAILGPLAVRTADGEVADVPGARLRGLLVALALRPGNVVPKGALVDWIWGEQPPADAANALQRLVSRLRKLLPPGVIAGQPDGYRLLVAPDDVDAVRFERLVSAGLAQGEDVCARARLLGEALGLWRGGALQDVGLPDSAACEAAVVRLEAMRLAATEERVDAEATLGRGPELVTELTDLVAAHPVRERLVAALIRALAAAGRDSEALLVFQRAREELADALGVDPSPELSALHVALLRGELGRRHVPQRRGTAPREAVRRTNLRAELTSFVGKDGEVVAVRELLAGHRLTTLVGPGGSGKTRLGVETARTLLDDLPDGAWLVELASVGTNTTADTGAGDGDGSDVAQAALAALGLRDALLGDTPHADPTERLIAAIRERETLLVLDNCEHLVESAAVFAHRVLGECRGLRILATSREPLGITGEALWPVEPLALPGPGATAGEIAASPAVRLLRDRAGAVRPDLTTDAGSPATLTTMARICRALDGMPLAIELAAARLRTMTLDQLAHRLDDRFRLLTGGSRTALPRHRTLRAVVDWSWELLSDAERAALRRLAVFSGGAGLEAAERVCAGEGVEPEDVLELLTSLVEKSLLLAESVEGAPGTQGDAAPRYRMINTIREYAAARLAEAGEAERARLAHLACFTELAEAADPHLRRAEQLEWLAVLGADHDNIGAAMRGALAAGEAQAAQRLAAGAGWYWWLGGHRVEGMELIGAAARMPGESTDGVRAMVYGLVVLFVSSGRGDEQQVAEWIREAHRFSRHGRGDYPLLGLIDAVERLLHGLDQFLTAFEPLLEDADPWIAALAHLHMGKTRIMLGQGGREADAYLEAALDRFRAIGERFGVSFALTELADRIAVRGDFATACASYEEAIAVVTELGAVEDVIRMRSLQAKLYRLLDDAPGEAAALDEAQRCAERVTWPNALAELALARADLARWDGDAQQARHQLDLATDLLGEDAALPNIRALRHDVLGRLAEDLDTARAHAAAAWAATAEAGIAPLTAQVLVGVAELALRREDPELAARLLAASAQARGLPDRSDPSAARVEDDARNRLGDVAFAEAVQQGQAADRSQLVEAALAP